jgi:hypothetical protein
MSTSTAFTDVPTAIEEIRAGRMIVVVDDEDRENEGDLTMAAEKITPGQPTSKGSDGRLCLCHRELELMLPSTGSSVSSVLTRDELVQSQPGLPAHPSCFLRWF